MAVAGIPASYDPRPERRGRLLLAGRTGLAAVTLLAIAVAARAQTEPVPGQNINMVSGTSFPGGDPFLQRQNEPSLAVSSHLGHSNAFIRSNAASCQLS